MSAWSYIWSNLLCYRVYAAVLMNLFPSSDGKSKKLKDAVVQSTSGGPIIN
jgi:hypothetical protein